MRKRVLNFILFAAIVVAAGWNINQNRKDAKLSGLALENVEALASGESGGEIGITCGQYTGQCWTSTYEICYRGEGTYDRCKFDGSVYSHCANRCAGY